MNGDIQETGDNHPLHPTAATGVSRYVQQIVNRFRRKSGGDDQPLVGHGMSFWGATMFIVGEMAGSGVLALPQALAGAGWIGIVMIVVCCLNACYCGIHLGRCWLIMEERWADCRGKVRNPYPTMGEKVFGIGMKRVVSFCVDLTLFGASTVYLLLCAGLIGSLLADVAGIVFCNWILIIGAVVLPFTFFGTPADFWQAAVMALLTTALACVLIVTSALTDPPERHASAHFDSPTFSSFFLSFGTILFAFGGASTFPTFQNDMSNKKEFPKAAIFGFLGLFLLYIPVALSGYFVFGSDVGANVLDSIQGGAVKQTIQVFLAAHFLFAFVIVFNPLAQEMEEMFKVPPTFGWRRCLVRSVIMVFIVFMGTSIPHFGKILSLVGGSTVTLMTFVFPPIFYMRLCDQKQPSGQSRLSFSSLGPEWPKHEISLHKRVYFIEIIGMGLLGGAVATYSAIMDIADPAAFTPPCYINVTAAGS